MQTDTTTPARVTLYGEWTMNEAAERLKLLAGELALLLEADPRPARAGIDLAGVASIDACGCQLLAVLQENLKRHGIAPEPCRIPPEVMEKIRLLGFAEAFTAGAPEKENA